MNFTIKRGISVTSSEARTSPPAPQNLGDQSARFREPNFPFSAPTFTLRFYPLRDIIAMPFHSSFDTITTLPMHTPSQTYPYTVIHHAAVHHHVKFIFASTQ